MTKLFKTAETTSAPAWFNQEFKSAISTSEAQRIASMPEDLTEDQVVVERDVIEKCASAQSVYRYSSKWSQSTKSQLLEYAAICGAQAEAIDPASPNMKYYAQKASEASLQKTASVQAPAAPTLAEEVARLVGDPFHLDSAGDMKHMEKADWESVRPSVKASDVPQISMTGASVLNIGSATESSEPRRTRVAPGQNSMIQPNAIGELIKEQEQDTSSRLRQQAKERQEKRVDANRQSDASMVAKAEEAEKEIPGGLPSGSVFTTEARTASGRFTGGHIPSKDIPEKTAGEMIRDKNLERKASIQRQKEDAREWDSVQGASRHVIDETFIDAIKKQMGE